MSRKWIKLIVAIALYFIMKVSCYFQGFENTVLIVLAMIFIYQKEED